MADRPLGPATISKDRVFENARQLAAYTGIHEAGTRQSYLRSIQAIQALQLDLHPEAPGPVVSFGPVDPNERAAYCAVMAVDSLPDNYAYASEERDLAQAKIADALELIGRHAPDTRTAIDTAIGTFLLAKLDGFEGGSVSSLMGAIWIGLPATRPAEDFAELIVHEYTHNALFLEDMVHGVFIDGEARLGEGDALVTSAILRIPRGYDKAFHSAVVAAVLGEFRSRIGRVVETERSEEPLAVTMAGLREKDAMLTENGLRVLAELVRWVSERPRTDPVRSAVPA